ncbi:MAG: DUF6385 domain-containing protein [Bacillota bacterium]
MPNYKVFQDNPDSLKIKIFGSQNQAINTDNSGSIVITSTGLAVTGSINVGTVTVTSTGLSVTGAVDVGTVTVTSTGLAVTGNINVGTVTVTTGSGQLAVSLGTGLVNVSMNNLATTDVTEVIANNASVTASGATARPILGYSTWTFAVKNSSTVANAQAVVQLQLSAVGVDESDWINDGSPVTLNQNSVAFLVGSYQVKYARIYYRAVDAASAVTLNITYQAQI